MDAPSPSMFDRVFPLTILVLLGLALPTALLLINRFGNRWAIGRRDADPGKHEPYECGLTSTAGGAGERFPVKFYLVAMLFLAFDIEVAFLYPWAMALRDLRWLGVVQVLVFFVILAAGYLYVWRKGALNWDRA